VQETNRVTRMILCVCFLLIVSSIFLTHQLELHSFVKRWVVCLLLVFYLTFVYELSEGCVSERKTNESKLGEWVLFLSKDPYLARLVKKNITRNIICSSRHFDVLQHYPALTIFMCFIRLNIANKSWIYDLYFSIHVFT
jgi:hypothetical protein